MSEDHYGECSYINVSVTRAREGARTGRVTLLMLMLDVCVIA